MGLYDSRVEQARKDISRLRQKIAAYSTKVASERARASAERIKASKASSSSSRASHERSAVAADGRANRAEQDRASAEKDIARREKQLFDAMAQQDKERTRKDADRLVTLEKQLRQTRASQTPVLPANPTPGESADRSWDFFISHASPDKDEIVRDLAQRLRDRGAKVWYDEFELTVGDSLRAKIDEGLRESRFGIVVLTHAYLQGRQWTENELNGLFAANKRILPIWHGVSHDEVASYSPMLADRIALTTAVESLIAIVEKLLALLPDTDQES